jgi:curved DNA-binding protein CbpA
MVARRDFLPFDEDPRALLGVGPDASDEDIRQAYLRKVRAHPPERDPETFEKIRDAYELLRDPRRRAALILLAPDPEGPLTDLLGKAGRGPTFVGPQPWLDVIGEGTHGE